MNRHIILLSGGIGSRFRSKIPKQYNKNFNGDYYFVESLKCFLPHIKLFDQLVVVCDEKYVRLIKNQFDGLDIEISFALSGITRQESINNGIEHLRKIVDINKENQIFIQETVRPFVRPKTIFNLINVDKKYKSVSLSLSSPVLHSVYNKATSEGTQLIKKDEIIELQLPKRYDLNFWLEKTISNPYNINAIDESQLFIDYGISVKCIQGFTTNIKITYPEHKHIGESILKIIEQDTREAANDSKK